MKREVKCSQELKKVAVAIFITGKVDFRAENSIKDEKHHFLRIGGNKKT